MDFLLQNIIFEPTGWGKIKHPGSSHRILQQAVLPPVANDVCAKKLAASPGNATRYMNKIGNANVLPYFTDSKSEHLCGLVTRQTYPVIEERNAPTQTHYIEKQCFA